MHLPGPQLRPQVQPLVAVRRCVSAAERQKFFFNGLSKCVSWEITYRKSRGSVRARTAHLFQEVPGFLREVRWKAEFTFQDFVDGLLSVFAGEWRLWKSEKGTKRWHYWLILPTEACLLMPVLLWKMLCCHCGIHGGALTAPVSMSYIRAPRLHQSTARLCPLLIRISGALKQEKKERSTWYSRDFTM